MNVFDSQGKAVRLGEIVGRGGEATVFRTANARDSLAKIYAAAPRQNYQAKLAWMVTNPPENPTQSLGHASLAWPTGLLFDGRRHMAGYLMPHIRQAVPVLEVFNPRRRQITLPKFNRRYLHRVARNLAATIGALHARGYIVGDLNESNVLVTPPALVTIIDTDSFQVQEQHDGKVLVHYCPVGKLEYTPPELQGQSMEQALRKAEHDAFGLAVLIFQLLMEGNHPFRAQWLAAGDPPPLEARIAQGFFPYTASPLGPVNPPKNALELSILHPLLAEMARRCFVDGHRDPSQRPEAAQWERAIAEAEKALIACPSGHIYSNHLRACPSCGASTPGTTFTPVSIPLPANTTPAGRAKAAHPGGPGAGNSPRWAFPRVLRAPIQAARQSSQQGNPSSPPPSSPSPGVTATASATWPSWNWSLPSIHLQAPVWIQRIRRSPVVLGFVHGGVTGAGTGALAGAAAGASSLALGVPASWLLLSILGGVSAGILRGWKPGSRLGNLINRTIGWRRFWQASGMLGGAGIGAFAGLLAAGFLIFPIFIGLFTGARLGWEVGKRIWLAGIRYGWERIWTLTMAGNAAAFGALVAWIAGATPLGDWFAGLPGLASAWLLQRSASDLLIASISSAIAGAFGGLFAGFLVELGARVSRLAD